MALKKRTSLSKLPKSLTPHQNSSLIVVRFLKSEFLSRSIFTKVGSLLYAHLFNGLEVHCGNLGSSISLCVLLGSASTETMSVNKSCVKQTYQNRDEWLYLNYQIASVVELHSFECFCTPNHK